MVATDTIDLDGAWTVWLDPTRTGIEDAWFDRPLDGESVHLPGALRESGIGDPVGPDTDWIGSTREELYDRVGAYESYRDPDRFAVPFWLQPERHYVGPAWYERTVEIPAAWEQGRILLHLERPHWHTTVWIDGNRIGAADSLSTPHEYDLTETLDPGTHRLTVRIDNSLEPVDVGVNAHSVSDHTQTAWHGIVGELSLRLIPSVRIEDVQVHPDAANRTARVAVSVAGDSHASETPTTVDIAVEHDDATVATEVLNVDTPETVETTLDLDGVPPWSEFEPALCTADITLRSDAGTHRERTRFGLCDVSTEGTYITVNDRPTVLRGTLECCVFPDTGYPPTDVAAWREVFRTCADHGLNHVRFHSWCPPEAAFDAADDIGIYLQVECGSWPNQSTGLGEDEPIDEWLYDEAARILRAYGNHPSLLLLAAGNEPGGNDEAYLSEWVESVSARTDRCLVTGGSGWPLIAENEFHVSPEPRIHAWGAGLDDRLTAEPPATTADYRAVHRPASRDAGDRPRERAVVCLSEF